MRIILFCLLAAVLPAGCAGPMSRDGEPMGVQQALCEMMPGRTCCRARPAPPPAAYCTRSLGIADCWQNPTLLPNQPRGLNDTPSRPHACG